MLFSPSNVSAMGGASMNVGSWGIGQRETSLLEQIATSHTALTRQGGWEYRRADSIP